MKRASAPMTLLLRSLAAVWLSGTGAAELILF